MYVRIRGDMYINVVKDKDKENEASNTTCIRYRVFSFIQ